MKVLLDGAGTSIAAIEKQSTLPARWEGTRSVVEFLQHNSAVEVRTSPNPWMTGDHTKTVTIDGEIAYAGGMNIAREYRYDWHDMMVEIRGPVVSNIEHDFAKAWAHAGIFGDIGYLAASASRPERHFPEPSHYPVRLLISTASDNEIYRVQKAAIQQSKQRIYVQNPYFTDDALLAELLKARQRGVDVRVIIPLVTDRGPITRNNILAANIMLAQGIRVYVYPRMSHVKAAVFDGWACFGSANWDRWSLSLNKELNLATSHAPAVDALVDRLFEPDFMLAEEIKEPLPERWSDSLLEFIGD